MLSAATLSKRCMSSAKTHFKVLVAGGGAGGLSVGSHFGDKLGADSVAIVEPSSKHYYQPLWTLVGGGIKQKEESVRDVATLMPKSTTWIQSGISEFDPENNTVRMENGKSLTYDYLVVALGIDVHTNSIAGVQEALDNPDAHVSTNYSYQYVDNTWKNIQALTQGRALFTQPSSPVKCAGAPQKIMYLAEDYFRKHGVRDNIEVAFRSGMPKLFSAPKYSARLEEICGNRDIDVQLQQNLVEVDGIGKKAVFEGADGSKTTESFDMLHVTPLMGPRTVLKGAPISNEGGWVDVHKETLQHNKYENIFALGDCSSLPTSKTAAAVAEQGGIVKANLAHLLDGEDKSFFAKYDGYTSCPLVTGYGRLILAEFDYNLEPKETFPFDQGKESAMLYKLKADIMPALYWRGLIADRWDGPGSMRSVLHLGMA